MRPGDSICFMASCHCARACSIFRAAASFTAFFFWCSPAVASWMTCPEPGTTVACSSMVRPPGRMSWSKLTLSLWAGVKSALRALRARVRPGTGADGDDVAGRLRACGDDEMVEDVDRLHDTAVDGLADLAHAHLAVEGDLHGGAVGNGEGDGARL